MFDLPGQNDIEEVIIDTGSVNGASEPVIVHSKITLSLKRPLLVNIINFK